MQSLHQLFLRFMNEYRDELEDARKTKKYARPFGDLVRNDIKESLERIVPPERYQVKGSVGVGAWTDVPWIAVFHTRITRSAQRGVYIVYLLNKDKKELYLTLNQGATIASKEGKVLPNEKLPFMGITSVDSRKTIENLTQRAKKIRELMGERSDMESGAIDTSSKAYNAGTIFYKKYTLKSLPDDEGLEKDLRLFIEIYEQYFQIFYGDQGGKKIQGEGKSKENDTQSEGYLRPGQGREKNGVETGTKETAETVSAKEYVEEIYTYLRIRGMEIEKELIKNIYLSLRTKPFLILAGVSGTGKSRIARLFAEAAGGRFQLIPVRPDWSDPTDLLGHVNLDGNFVPGILTEFLYEANSPVNQDIPYFVCLDEMNLARVEYYFSDFLSVMETRERVKSGRIETEKIFSAADLGKRQEDRERYGNLIISDNVYFIGTVNVDETTFPFSKKVLDRANTIEFSYIDLMAGLEKEGEIIKEKKDEQTVRRSNAYLWNKYVQFQDCWPGNHPKEIRKMVQMLTRLNEVLANINARIGYRVRNEIAYYLSYALDEQLFVFEEAMDLELMQKILPRIQGSGQGMTDTLRGVLKVLAPERDFGENNLWEEVSQYIEEKEEQGGVIYEKSIRKILFMIRRLEQDGYTSYWL